MNEGHLDRAEERSLSGTIAVASIMMRGDLRCSSWVHLDRRPLISAQSSCVLGCLEVGRARTTVMDQQVVRGPYLLRATSTRPRSPCEERIKAYDAGGARSARSSMPDRAVIEMATGRQEGRCQRKYLPRLHPGRDGPDRQDLARRA
ncbi:MAG: hypothetical protein MZU95_15215 [Desulfomicrobium escambiense]|nr:hypothetical protein [Desulfomicrobium escambiense]